MYGPRSNFYPSRRSNDDPKNHTRHGDQFHLSGQRETIKQVFLLVLLVSVGSLMIFVNYTYRSHSTYHTYTAIQNVVERIGPVLLNRDLLKNSTLVIHKGKQYDKTQKLNQTQTIQQINVKIDPNITMVTYKIQTMLDSQQPKPAVRQINPGVLQGIVNKAKPPHDNKVNPHDYNLVINEPTACEHANGSSRDVFLLVLVNSIHVNFDRRSAIRSTYGSAETVHGKRVVTLFTLAKNNDTGLNKKLEEESRQHHDILLEDFFDTYKNLTLKSIMAMKYAAIYCEKAKFVMKTNDEMYINCNSLVEHLARPSTPTQNYFTGFILRGGPIRDPKSKWYMPDELYPEKSYPPYCAGPGGYVMSGDVALKVYAISEYIGLLPIEDVFTGICVDKFGIVPVTNTEFHNTKVQYDYCRFKRIFTNPDVGPDEMNKIWKDQHLKRNVTC